MLAKHTCDAAMGDNQISAAERIKELSSIDQDVARVLQSAGQAFSVLSDDTPQSLSGKDASDPTERFENHCNEYFTIVQSIAARLRRQAYALEEAGIIAVDSAAPESQTSQASTSSASKLASDFSQGRPDVSMPITNGGLGNLDIGWLNSRRDDVGRHKEAELWAEARKRAEKLEQDKVHKWSGPR